MNRNIGIKVPVDAPLARCVSIIRDFCPLSIGEIKNRISNNEYLLEYDYIDPDGVNTVISCYRMLIDAKIAADLYEHDRPCQLSFLENLSGMYSEIDTKSNEEV